MGVIFESGSSPNTNSKDADNEAANQKKRAGREAGGVFVIESLPSAANPEPLKTGIQGKAKWPPVKVSKK